VVDSAPEAAAVPRDSASEPHHAPAAGAAVAADGFAPAHVDRRM